MNNRNLTRKLKIAAALATVFALPIAAQAQTNVIVYGKLYPDITHVNVSGGTAAGTPVSTLAAPAGGANVSATSMDSPNSRLGFRGSEDLGGGLSAVFQLEMGFSSDTGAASNSSAPFSRNTFVGLSGQFGTIRLGNMDTVFKDIGDQMTFLGINSANFMATSNILAKPAFGSSQASSFHLRRTNSFYYTTPVIAGFTGLFDWSPNETPGDGTAGVISTGVKYQHGPLYAALAYEVHKDMFGASLNIPTAIANSADTGQSSKDTSLRETVQYVFPGDYKVELDVEQTKYLEDGGAFGHFKDYRHNTWNLGIEKPIDLWTLVAAYGQSAAGSCSLVGVACSTSGLAARMFNMGASYSLSKRTSLFAVYSYMGNDASGVQNNWINGKISAGQDTSTIAMGISHSF
jgi:predicted porin